MKKILLLALTAIMMVGCTQNKHITVTYDDCEYISNLTGVIKAHKGNCRFCAERDSIRWEKRKQEIIKALRED